MLVYISINDIYCKSLLITNCFDAIGCAIYNSPEMCHHGTAGGDVGDGEQLSKGGRGRHGDVQDRTLMLAP